MNERGDYADGEFCGVDLATPDLDASARFWDGCGYTIMRERPSETNRVLEGFIGRDRVGKPPLTMRAVPAAP